MMCNRSARPVNHTLTEYKREVTPYAITFRKVNESFGGLLPLYHFTLFHPLDILFLSQQRTDDGAELRTRLGSELKSRLGSKCNVQSTSELRT
ncbi:hypothetical protein EVAR_694_1 [Eumeta japonica]|uniref:Uncharacterized protein n=1 Tax=Eumeta variegata TaxID=151549 RepID=A0A4C1SBP4_EUMVA|nr:hypothetical protein EVAR_694_1 [Eumeta japonica]